MNNLKDTDDNINNNIIDTDKSINDDTKDFPDYSVKEIQKDARKFFSKIGLSYFLFSIAVLVSQFLLALVIRKAFNDNVPGYMNFVLLMLSTYVIGFPVLYLCLRKCEVTKLSEYTLSLSQIIKYLIICAGLCGVGSLVGTPVHAGITRVVGADLMDTSAIEQLLEGSSFIWRLICPCILAPIFEELIFRKLLIDRIVKYGEGVAIVCSGVMFGLFHGNFSQFFYACFLGLFFAYIYIRTGKIWYTILFHFVVNFTSGIISTGFISKIDMDFYNIFASDPQKYLNPNGSFYLKYYDKINPIMNFLYWTGFLAVLAFAGVIILLVIFKRFYLVKRSHEIPGDKRFGIVCFNFGFIAFGLMCLFLFLSTYLSPVLLKYLEQL